MSVDRTRALQMMSSCETSAGDLAADAGLLRRLELGDHVWRYEPTLSRDLHAVSDHPHFVCTNCGRVKCLDDRPDLDGMRALIQSVGTITEIFFNGRCLECQNGAS